MTDKHPMPPFYLPSRWEGIIAGTLGFLVYLVFVYCGEDGRGTVAGAFFGALVFSIRSCWPLRKQFWYGLEMSVLILIHVLVIVAFPWSFAADWTGLTVMPFMAFDLLLIMSTIFCSYVVMRGQPDSLFVPDDHIDYRQ
jgi:hypothetical protein